MDGQVQQAPSEGQEQQAPREQREPRERRSRDRNGRDRRNEDQQDSSQAAPVTENAEPVSSIPVAAPVQRPVAQAPAPVVAPVVAAAAAAPAGLPKVQAYALPVADMAQIAESSGLQWVGSDAAKIAAVQAQIAAEPKPVHVPRERPPVVEIKNEPLVMVETKRDLAEMKLPFQA
jgi:ribonuclease E